MNLTLSKRGDYVVRAALSLAGAYASGEQKKIREVVAEMGVPQTYASQILTDLVRTKLAVSKAGRDGGYRLARSPESITLLEVVEAGEGPLRAERCALSDGPCRWDAVCPLHTAWGGATANFRAALAKTTLAEILGQDEALRMPNHEVPGDSHRHGAVTVLVEDWVQVEAGLMAVADYLDDLETTVESHIVSAYEEAETLRRAVDGASLPWTPGSVTAVVQKMATKVPSGDALSYQITWQAGGTRGPQSRLEGELNVVSIDEDRTELRLSSTFRPPPKSAESDMALTEKLSRATVRSALRILARSIEGAPELIHGPHA